MSAKTVEIRAVDALLRLTRDRLLVTSSRLARTVRHWERRVKMHRTLGRLARFFLRKKTREGDQAVLAVARAAYDAEVTRLGAIQRILVERPKDVDDRTILRVLATTATADDKTDNNKVQTTNSKSKALPRKISPIRFTLPNLSRYSLRWNVEGRGRLQIRVSDYYESLSSDAAWQALFRDRDGESPRQWISRAHEWTAQARGTLCQIIKESLETSVLDAGNLNGELVSVEGWCTCNYEHSNVTMQWTTILNLVDAWDEHRRVEGRALRAGLGVWKDRLDVFGIPSALVSVGLALIVHNRLLPYWPKFKHASLELISIVWTVFRRRVWEPFYGIVHGLISKKSDSLLDAFDVDNEETSLDNMLRDLGLGDGTPGSRRAAIQGAARAYENEMDSGVLKSAFRGRLVRLLLVQVQQLKAGLLHALSSIDVLVAANKLNLQILAAIPSVLLVIFGTRFFLRALFTVRSKDIRSLTDVHTEMANYLDEMEKGLIMARRTPSQEGSKTTASDVPLLQFKELGEFVLHMRSYLVLLDYCSPPFPSRSRDAIQKSMQELLTMQASTEVLGADPQVALLHLLRHKHTELLKYI
jgi:nuclear-control-of-ATPase protein 2